ncbi:MAG TPA: AAA family ATPase [Ktedonobacterales bacterium]|nr:AAA family ATPase [Ktedonobacterales bacterium]
MNAVESASIHAAHVAPQSFASLLRALSQPGAFPPDADAQSGSITIAQTHASAVLLTSTRAYKLKKPQDFGFLDYSTPALRRHFCAREATLNQTLAPGVYLGVAPVLMSADGELRFGDTLPPRHLPQPGARVDGARVVDYAVVMSRLPEEATLAALVRANLARPALLAEIAQRIAAFHARGAIGARRARYGSPQSIAANWAENFDQMRPYVGRTLSAEDDAHIHAYVEGFLAARAPLLRARLREGRIRDCHGDLRMEHVYRLNAPEPPGYRLAFVDRIEFLDRFRYSDVAAEIAFLAMELDGAGRPDLSSVFVDAYIAASGDDAAREPLPFYACYRAYVRGKVRSFELDEPETTSTQRADALAQARALFMLAADYARGPQRAQFIMVGGLMGVGKSTLAALLCDALGALPLSSDALRKRLAGLDPAHPVPAAYGANIYNADWSRRTYAALLDEARRALASGRSVVLDASFSRQVQRLAAMEIGQACGADIRFIEATCPEEVALERLAHRWRQRVAAGASGPIRPTPDAQASDGRPELYAAQAAAWEPYDATREAAATHLRLDTTEPPHILRERLLESLAIPRPVCWLNV